MKTKDICQLVYDKYNIKGEDEIEFSLPYIYQYLDKEYISFFLCEINDDWPKLEVTNFSKIILVDYYTGEIKEINDFKSEYLEVKSHYLVDYSELLKESDKSDIIADKDYIQDNYYKLLDDYFNGKVIINEYIDIVCNILPKDFREVYNDFGGKFFKLSLYSKKS